MSAYSHKRTFGTPDHFAFPRRRQKVACLQEVQNESRNTPFSERIDPRRVGARSDKLCTFCPGDPVCLGRDCTICSGWDCNNSFIDENRPTPQSFASRDAVTQCYQGIDEYTRDLADGHFEPLARLDILTWGPARVWTYQESQAWGTMVSDIKDCMEQQGWIYCCRGYYCELDFSRSGSRRWICLRKPGILHS